MTFSPWWLIEREEEKDTRWVVLSDVIITLVVCVESISGGGRGEETK